MPVAGLSTVASILFVKQHLQLFSSIVLCLLEAENFATKFASGTGKLTARQEEMLLSLAQVPLTILEPLAEPNL